MDNGAKKRLSNTGIIGNKSLRQNRHESFLIYDSQEFYRILGASLKGLREKMVCFLKDSTKVAIKSVKLF